MYDNLSLRNFTVFKDADLDFTGGVNVYTGANGTGKTHILKLLYAMQKHQHLAPDPQRVEELDRTLMAVFCPDALGRLVRRKAGNDHCAVSAKWRRKTLSFDLSRLTKKLPVERIWPMVLSPVFIPAKDILGHSVRFIEAYENRWADFDVTYRDLLLIAVPDVGPGPVPTSQQGLLRALQRHMEGRVTRSKAGRFYLKDSAGQIEFPLVAEGWRKLGLLWTLIRNGSLSRGSVLYWDEPEAGLNPAMLPIVADIVCQLAVAGTQVHIATHSYPLIRELEFHAVDQRAGLRLFALERTPSDGVRVQATDRFGRLEPQPDPIGVRTDLQAHGPGRGRCVATRPSAFGTADLRSRCRPRSRHSISMTGVRLGRPGGKAPRLTGSGASPPACSCAS
ncbi:MAG: AAA family ATPase [Armatimonadetes bacterium]|nr:AAA family ATPase [Armatimonadota bacterium]